MGRFALMVTVLLCISHACLAQTSTTYDKTSYDLRVQRQQLKALVITANKVLLNVEASVIFYIKEKDVPQIHATIGPGYATTFVVDIAQSELRAALSKIEDTELLGAKRDTFMAELTTNTAARLEKYHIQLRDFALTAIDYPPEVALAIIEKLVAREQVEAAKYQAEAEKIKWEMQQKAAEAEAKKNAVVSRGLDKKLLQLKYIEALLKLAESANSKVIVVGDGKISLPEFEESRPLKIPPQFKK